MSSRFAAPSLQTICQSAAPEHEKDVLPLEHSIVRQELVEICHELVDSFSHVQMSNFSPHGV